jgi:hypothetical protein
VHLDISLYFKLGQKVQKGLTFQLIYPKLLRLQKILIVVMKGQREKVILTGSWDKKTELLKHILIKAINKL